MKKLFSILLIISTLSAFAQQAIVIDPMSMTVPRYADLAAIQEAIYTPQTGMMVYNIATHTNWTYNGTAWVNTYEASKWSNSANGIYNNQGNVGIGTVPYSLFKLSVVGHTASAMSIDGPTRVYTTFLENATERGYIGSFHGSDQDFDIGVHGSNSTGSLHFVSNQNIRQTILPNGNIGIGTTNPTEKLEVNGKIKTTNFQMITGSNLNRVMVSDANGNGNWQDPLWNLNGINLTTPFINGNFVNTGINQPSPKSSLDIQGTFGTAMYIVNLAFGGLQINELYSVYYITGDGAGVYITIPQANIRKNRRYIIVNSTSTPSLININNNSFKDFFGNFATHFPANSSTEIISDGTNWLQIK